MADNNQKASDVERDLRLEVARHILHTLLAERMNDVVEQSVASIRKLCEISLEEIKHLKDAVAKQLAEKAGELFCQFFNKEFVDARIIPIWVKVFSMESATDLAHIVEQIKEEVDIEYFFDISEYN